MNGLMANVESNEKSFADDAKIYKTIKAPSDAEKM